MKQKVTILGCGASGGVPRIGGVWGNCDPDNPRNRRRRCSILIEQFASEEEVTRVLIDTPPDIRMQLLDAGVGVLDAVLYTHEHADHTHGIDDLRQVAFNSKDRVDVYLADRLWDRIVPRFSYCFEAPAGSPYPPILNAKTLTAYDALHLEGAGGAIDVLPFWQHHGSIMSLGFRVGNFIYSTDVSDFPEESVPCLEGVDTWIIDALRYAPHKTHFNVDAALHWIDRIKPRRAILTNMHHDLDYETLRRELPAHVEPGYDGLTLQILPNSE